VRILFAGATGVLGQAALPHLHGHDVVAITRSPEKRQLLRELAADPVQCDVYDYDALLGVATRVQPQTVVNFVTDLSKSSASNNRARREGGENLRKAAAAAGASRLVVESVAFALEGDAAQAVEQLERSTRAFGGDAVVIRFGRLWGTGTWYRTPPAPPAVHSPRQEPKPLGCSSPHRRERTSSSPRARRRAGDGHSPASCRPAPLQPTAGSVVAARDGPAADGGRGAASWSDGAGRAVPARGRRRSIVIASRMPATTVTAAITQSAAPAQRLVSKTSSPESSSIIRRGGSDLTTGVIAFTCIRPPP